MRTASAHRACAVLAAVLLATTSGAAEEGAGHGEHGVDWRAWRAGNQIDSIASLQRGARSFFSYCHACHSLKYVRYSRLGSDLLIPPQQLEQYLLPASAKATDYVLTPMPAEDAQAWFGKAPPDLSLMARARGTDYLFQFLKTFYADPAQPTRVNNLALEATAMPHVLSELEGVKRAVFREVGHGAGETRTTERVLERFEMLAPGRLEPAEYDAFVRDIVNFLDYAGEPTQVARRALGIWVVLFLAVFTWLAWLLKKDYWKDVR